MTLCLMVCDWQVSRAEPILSCWHDLLFLFCLFLFYPFLPSMGLLCEVGVFGLIEGSHYLPPLHSGLQLIIIIIIIIILLPSAGSLDLHFSSGMITLCIRVLGSLPVSIQPAIILTSWSAVAQMQTYRPQMEFHHCQQPYYFSVLSQFVAVHEHIT